MDSANALLHVINDVLDFSKIEAGKMTVAREDFPVRAVVESVLGKRRHAGGPPKKSRWPPSWPGKSPSGSPAIRPGCARCCSISWATASNSPSRAKWWSACRSIFNRPAKIVLRFEVADTGIGLHARGNQEVIPALRAGGHLVVAEIWRHGSRPGHFAENHRTDGRAGSGCKARRAPAPPSGLSCPLACRRSRPSNAFSRPGLFANRGGRAQSQPAPVAPRTIAGWGRALPGRGGRRATVARLRHDLRAAVIPLVICDDEMLAQGGEELKRLLADHKDACRCILLASPASSLGADAAGPVALANVCSNRCGNNRCSKRSWRWFAAWSRRWIGAWRPAPTRRTPGLPDATGRQTHAHFRFAHSGGRRSSLQPQALPVDAR